ncbi:hypothetical protein IEQ34_022657 [Dendrobium chrysotoxum]|uniref:Uncharacterized protein n=1 Tax=Dendrobium chrysotoxum TaxID=161865 RepID=A0AAV7FYC0_DENCH|nr:hypothetical protein IEQ34_022657 [Dendrobium chrysotoxum]
MGDHTSTKIPPAKGDCPAVQSEGLKKSPKKKFHFPNDLVIKVPEKFADACSSPPVYLTVYEFNFSAGLRFPPPPKLIDILTTCGVSLSQLSYRAMSIVMGSIMFFRDCGAVVIEEFKKSVAFKMIIKDQIQKARNQIYDVEVKDLELECIEECFIRDFLKGVHLVHRKTGAEIEGLRPSQASGDSSSDFDGDEVESELKKAFFLEDEDDVDIL